MTLLDSEQQRVIDLLNERKSVLLVGQAGTGKSRIIKELVESNSLQVKAFLTSTTGVSALNIGGVTLYSFLGIQLGEGSAEELYIKVKKNYKVSSKLKRDTTLLIIDEISMLPLVLFEKIDYIFKKIKGNNQPFGGVQMLLSGDFLQLEPINAQPIYKSHLINSFTFVKLTKNYRQENNEEFQTILTNLRTNSLTDHDKEVLKSKTKTVCNDFGPVRIFTTNAAVNNYNAKFLNENKNKGRTFKAQYTGESVYKKDLQKQFQTKNIDTLVLKENLKVMLTKNLDLEFGLVNGTLGVIKEFIGGLPIVKFNNGIEMCINETTWESVLDGKKVAVAKQLPLIIAYSFTVYKVQGLTLESAVIDLKNCFAPHIAYVALSRVKNLDNLTLLNFNPDSIKVNKETLDFYSEYF
jgi:ATP-dependent DNA helicase PIF1